MERTFSKNLSNRGSQIEGEDRIYKIHDGKVVVGPSATFTA